MKKRILKEILLGLFIVIIFSQCAEAVTVNPPMDLTVFLEKYEEYDYHKQKELFERIIETISSLTIAYIAIFMIAFGIVNCKITNIKFKKKMSYIHIGIIFIIYIILLLLHIQISYYYSKPSGCLCVRAVTVPEHFLFTLPLIRIIEMIVGLMLRKKKIQYNEIVNGISVSIVILVFLYIMCWESNCVMKIIVGMIIYIMDYLIHVKLVFLPLELILYKEAAKTEY